MPDRSPLAPVVARLRTTNPYAVDAVVAALVLFAVSLQWLFPDEGDDPLSWRGWLLGAATAVPLVWRRAEPFATACAVSVATPAQAVYHAPQAVICAYETGLVARSRVARPSSSTSGRCSPTARPGRR